MSCSCDPKPVKAPRGVPWFCLMAFTLAVINFTGPTGDRGWPWLAILAPIWASFLADVYLVIMTRVSLRNRH